MNEAYVARYHCAIGHRNVDLYPSSVGVILTDGDCVVRVRLNGTREGFRTTVELEIRLDGIEFRCNADDLTKISDDTSSRSEADAAPENAYLA
jgi:hypothetical protein